MWRNRKYFQKLEDDPAILDYVYSILYMNTHAHTHLYSLYHSKSKNGATIERVS